VDPSVEFGLRFETQDDEEEDGVLDELPEEINLEEIVEEPRKDAEVVSLDSFRK
jgi:hypothetical protein